MKKHNLFQKLPFQRKHQKKENLNYYELLKVQPTANQDDILKSYIRLTIKHKKNASENPNSTTSADSI